MDDDLTPAGSWREDDWSWWRPGEKVGYPIIFPEMDDEPYWEGDHYYDAEEFYCVTPGCTCREVDVAFFDLADADADTDEEWMVGTVTLDASTGQSLRMQGEKGGKELLGRLFLAYQSRMAGRPGLLMERLLRMMGVGEEIAALAKKARQPVRSGPKIGPNDRCPCGSGRKYKMCCQP